MTPLVVGVVGAGAAGTLSALHLVTESRRVGRPVEVVLVDPADGAGRGVAYGTVDERHLLNVPVSALSAHPDQPAHLLSWLHDNGWPETGPGDFVPRCRYGRYLAETLDTTVAAGSGATVRRVLDRVVGLHRDGDGLCLDLAGAEPVRVDAAVLATGIFPPGTAWAPAGLVDHPRFVADPWAAGVLADVAGSGDSDVLLVGTGLTMVDVAMSLDRPGRRLHAVSRRGRLPRAHRVSPQPRLEPVLPETRDLDTLRAAVLDHVRATLRERGDWRPAIDGLRPVTACLWAGLDDAEKAQFVRDDAPLWDVHRHRMPPRTAAVVAELRQAGRLTTGRGQVTGARPDADGRVTVTFADGSTRTVDRVVNCTGPDGDVRRVADPLLDQLLATGAARPGPLGLGLATDDGRLLADREDAEGLPVWTLGALRRGELWESTAIPEIRAQAAELAVRVMDRLVVRAATTAAAAAATTDPGTDPRPSRPRDLLGLPLSTTAEAAEAYDTGLDLVMRVQSGAVDAFRRAAELDPGFAMAPAALALLGHESGADVDVAAELARAQRLVARRGDDRERSLVDVVTRRVSDCHGDGARALEAHVRSHPRDALAVSAAVPTIAFSGVTDIQTEAWELVESLAPAYGDDWWYAGLLAFVRQDQGRYDEAAELSGRALAVHPSSGHAVHARTHVHYETGDHRAGLAWLDPWIATSGQESTHRAHYSWHAALHELSMGDADAVRSRYLRQLAPPYVAGVRALVDSGSLLWRCKVTGAWPEPREPLARDVLAAAGDDLVERPSTAFTALHSAVALAAAGDVEGLARLRTHLVETGDPTMRDVVVALCDALIACVEERWADAVRHLRLLGPWLTGLGGSAAQREVVEDTLVYALIGAGWCEEARALIDVRLDRRPSPLDLRRRARATSAAT